jgi:hypothetical protein
MQRISCSASSIRQSVYRLSSDLPDLGIERHKHAKHNACEFSHGGPARLDEHDATAIALKEKQAVPVSGSDDAK